MQKINFEDTTVTKQPYVVIDSTEYEVQQGTYSGGTNLDANTFNTLQDNVENAINAVDLDVYDSYTTSTTEPYSANYVNNNTVKNTDYASSTTGGVVKGNVNGFVIGSTGNPYADTYNYTQYTSMNNNRFIGKGTLENVFSGKKLNSNYSTDEQIIGTWTDGKDIYRKVINISNPQSTNTNYVNLGNLNIDKVIRLYGYKIDSNGYFNVPFYDSADNYSVLFVSSGKYLRGRFVGSTPTEVKAIIEYTKAS